MSKKDEVDISDLEVLVQNGASTQELLRVWDSIKTEFEPIAVKVLELSAREMFIRRTLIQREFIKETTDLMEVEGTRYIELANGWRLKAVIKVDRKVDEALLLAVEEQLQKLLIHTSGLTRRKPELVVKAYKELTVVARKIFDQALDIKMGTPILELIPPK